MYLGLVEVAAVSQIDKGKGDKEIDTGRSVVTAGHAWQPASVECPDRQA